MCAWPELKLIQSLIDSHVSARFHVQLFAKKVCTILASVELGFNDFGAEGVREICSMLLFNRSLSARFSATVRPVTVRSDPGATVKSGIVTSITATPDPSV